MSTLINVAVVRFMEAELELHDEIQQLRVVATVPEHYSLLVELGTVRSLLGLLSHDNTGMLRCMTFLIFCMSPLQLN